MNEYQMLVKAKEGNEEAKFDLWKKYERLIHKTFNKSREFFHMVNLEREDFVQESYIQFEDALAHFDLDRVTEPEGFSFYTFYSFYLKKIKNRSQAEFNHYGSVLHTSDIFVANQPNRKPDSIVSDLALNYNRNTAVNFDEEIEKESSRTVVRRYLGTVTEKERETLELYIADCKIVDIAKILCQTYSETYKIIQRSKKELSTIYMRTALA